MIYRYFEHTDHLRAMRRRSEHVNAAWAYAGVPTFFKTSTFDDRPSVGIVWQYMTPRSYALFHLYLDAEIDNTFLTGTRYAPFGPGTTMQRYERFKTWLDDFRLWLDEYPLSKEPYRVEDDEEDHLTRWLSGYT